jgi:HEAT repeat protein
MTDETRHLEQILSGNPKQILDTLDYLVETIGLEDRYPWNSPAPDNADLLLPFVESLNQLTSYDDEEFRVTAVELLRWSNDLRSVPFLIKAIDDELYDVREGAIKALAQLEATDACDAIHIRLLRDFEEEYADENGLSIIDDCNYHLVALGKLDDDRAYEILQRGLDNDDWREFTKETLCEIDTTRARQMLDNNS